MREREREKKETLTLRPAKHEVVCIVAPAAHAARVGARRDEDARHAAIRLHVQDRGLSDQAVDGDVGARRCPPRVPPESVHVPPARRLA